jgi:hypothetical protein
MSFEDVECLKNAFTIYGVPPKSSPPSTRKTVLMVRKRNTTFTRVIVSPPVYGIKHHFKMLTLSLLSKLGIKRA